MTSIIEKYNEKKHFLITGKSEVERKKYVDGIISISNRVIYRFKRNINSFDDYIEQVRSSFPFIPITWHEQNPKKWALNQIWDFHLDWTNDTKSILIILEEFEKIEDDWKIQILRDYFTTSYDQEQAGKSYLNFQLILSLPNEADLVKKVASVLGTKENEKRTNVQVIDGKLKILNLDGN